MREIRRRLVFTGLSVMNLSSSGDDCFWLAVAVTRGSGHLARGDQDPTLCPSTAHAEEQLHTSTPSSACVWAFASARQVLVCQRDGATAWTKGSPSRCGRTRITQGASTHGSWSIQTRRTTRTATRAGTRQVTASARSLASSASGHAICVRPARRRCRRRRQPHHIRPHRRIRRRRRRVRLQCRHSCWTWSTTMQPNCTAILPAWHPRRCSGFASPCCSPGASTSFRGCAGPI